MAKIVNLRYVTIAFWTNVVILRISWNGKEIYNKCNATSGPLAEVYLDRKLL